MADYKEKTIADSDGKEHVYRVTPRSAEEAIGLLARLSALAPAAAAVYAVMQTKGEGSAVNVEAIAGAVARAMDVGLMKEILKYTERDGMPVPGVFAVAFRANYAELVAAVAFAISVEFGSLKDLGKLLPQALG